MTSILNAASVAPRKQVQIHAVRARDGSTPLQVACACGASLEVIQALLDPPAGLINGGGLVECVDDQGLSPISELTVQYTLERQSAQNRDTSPRLEEADLVGGIGSPLFDAYWRKVEALIESSWSACAVDAERQALNRRKCRLPISTYVSVVHGAARLGGVIPDALVDLICRSYPHMVSFQDRKGVLPLHLAVCGNHSYAECRHVQVLDRRNAFIFKLLCLYPEGVRVRISGRSTLCHAILSGVPWSATADGSGPLRCIYEVAPEQVVERDESTGLYPFLLAAQGHVAFATPAAHLDTTFHLLRAHPQLLEELWCLK